jgi:hypothetical protein
MVNATLNQTKLQISLEGKKGKIIGLEISEGFY